MRWTWVVLASLVAAGCQRGPAGQAGPNDEDDDAEDDRGEGDPPVSEIVIPIQPVSSGTLYGLPDMVEADAGPRLRLESSVTLALGDGYPDRFVGAVPDAIVTSCGLVRGPVLLGQVAGNTGRTLGAANATLDGSAAIAFVAQAPGQMRFTAEGTVTLMNEACGQPAGAEVALDLIVDVAVARVAGARIDPPCAPVDGVIQVAPSSRGSFNTFASWFAPVLLDEAGEPLFADNVDADAPIVVRLRGAFDPGHAMPRSLPEWFTPSRPGLVEIEPELGDAIVVDVVAPGRITEAAIAFQLAGTASGPLTLEDGMTYGAGGWGRAANRIAPMVQELRTAAGPLCSGIPTSWWTLRSSTPDVCEVVELPETNDKLDLFTLYGDRTGYAGRLLRAGECSLALDAPQFGPDTALPTLTATFHDPDGLQE